jgi:hypothetical protein
LQDSKVLRSQLQVLQQRRGFEMHSADLREALHLTHMQGRMCVRGSRVRLEPLKLALSRSACTRTGVSFHGWRGDGGSVGLKLFLCDS